MNTSQQMATGRLGAVSALIGALLALAGCTGPWSEAVRMEVAAAEARMAQSEREADLEAQFDLLADDYVYIDAAGKRVTKSMLRDRRAADQRRPIALEVEGLEVVPIARDAALSRGLWVTTAEYYGGIPRRDAARYTALWRKRDGQWRMVADQVTPVVERETVVRERTHLPGPSLDRRVGAYALSTTTPMVVHIERRGDHLALRIEGALEQGIAFYPEDAFTFFAAERPWEIRFGDESESLTLVSWGIETFGRRLP